MSRSTTVGPKQIFKFSNGNWVPSQHVSEGGHMSRTTTVGPKRIIQIQQQEMGIF